MTSKSTQRMVSLVISVYCIVYFNARAVGSVDLSSSIWTESKCPEGTFKKDLYCLLNCGPGLYGNIATRTCLACSKACRTCRNGVLNDQCSSCYDPYYLYRNTCRKGCGELFKQGPPSSKIRLISDGSHFQGRLEVLREKTWGTICDDGWDINDAQVVCRELMLGDALAAVTMGRLGTGSDDQPIWLSKLQCTGNESRIDICGHKPWGTHSCGHFEDAGVICSGPDSTRRCVTECGPGYYKVPKSASCGVCAPECLACANTSTSCMGCGGTTFLKGNKCVRECGEGYFGNPDGRVCQKCDPSCRICSGNAKKCTGCEDDRFLSNTTCVKKCSVVEVAQQRLIRLSGTGRSSPYEGRVEVYRDGEWNTVCDDYWDFREATVVCRQLRMGRAIKSSSRGKFGPGSGRIWFDKLACTGSEKSIFDCPYGKVVWNSRCYHIKDSGVVCSGPQSGNPLTNMCVKECREGFYKDRNDLCKPCNVARCAACIGFSFRCTKCKAPKFLKENNCVSDCGSSSYGHLLSGTCKTCDKKCVSCANGNDGTNCTSCSAPLTLKDGKCTGSCRPDLYQHMGKCIKDCPIGYYSLSFNFTCLKCPKECFSCVYDQSKNAPKCILCKPPLVSNNGACTPNCSVSGKVSFPVANATGSVTIRLVNGSDYLEGLLQVFHNGEWGTICDDGWDYLESKVLCKQLNLGVQSSKPIGNIPKGTGRIWLDEMFCTGREKSLEDCVHKPWGENNCNHEEDVIVRCSGPGVRKCQDKCPDSYYATSGECKRCDASCATCVGNSTNCIKCTSGYYKNGSTCVTSCGDGFFLEPTTMECQSCNKTCATCVGNAMNCTSCAKPLYRKGSQCLPSCDPWYEPAVTHGIRLAGTKRRDNLEGRVELYYNGVWGTVCDDGWDIREATVACRMLNLGNASEAITTARFGAGKGTILLDDVNCLGNENSLGKCTHRGWGVENCEHSEDAGVRCSGPDRSRDCIEHCTNGYFKNSTTRTCGKCSPDCKTCMDFPDNCMSCEFYEFLNISSVRNICVQDCGDGSYADNSTRECKPCSPNCTGCFGDPTNCTSCSFGKFLDTETNICVSSCKDKTLINGVNDIRLAGTNKTTFGRLEVKYKGKWGTVCDDSFDQKDRDVACRQLKLGKGVGIKSSAYYGQGTGKIMLDDLQCRGTERSLFDCRMNSGGIGHGNCGHGEDVGIICSGPDTSHRCVRSCPAGFFKVKDKGKDVCKKCSSSCQACIGKQDNCNKCSPPLFLEGTKCVRKCTLGRYGNTISRKCLPCNLNCQTCLDGVSDNLCKTCAKGLVLNGTLCTKECGSMRSVEELLPPRPAKPSVRLVGGKTKQEGRVEVLHEETWGTVCDDQWDLNDAHVVCRELGFGKALKAPLHAEFGKGKGIIWIDNVDCYGYESSITQCRNHGWGINNCNSDHGEDASVVCDNTTIEDVANNYCREVLQQSCSNDKPCFSGVTCVNLGLLTNTGKTESVCLQCPDKYVGDGRICRVVSSTKPEFASEMPSNITFIAGNVIRIGCSAKSDVSTPPFDALITDFLKDGQQLDAVSIKTKRIVVSSGQLVINEAKRSDYGNYSCALTNTAGTTMGYTHVTIKEIPEIKDSRPVLVRDGLLALLTCVVSSFPQANLTWKRNGAVLDGGRYSTFNYTLAIHGVTAEDSGDYQCIAANELGKAMSKVTLTVGEPSKFLFGPSHQTVTKGEAKTLKCGVQGEPKPTITWKKDGKVVTPDENHVITPGVLTLNRVVESDIGYYACIARNPQNIITSFASLIMIGPPIIDIPPSNMSVLSGANVTFYCQSLAFPEPAIKWKKNDKLLKTQHGNTRVKDTLTLYKVTIDDAGPITCEASNGKGSAKQTVYLSVDGQTGTIKLASKKPKTKGGLSVGVIVAVVVILAVILLVIIGLVVYRFCVSRYNIRGDTSCVRYELGDDSGKPDRLSALKYKMRPGGRGASTPMGMYDDSKPFADHDSL